MKAERRLSAELLAEVSAFIAARMGLHFPPDRWRDLERALGEAAPALGCRDAETCAHRLMEAPLTREQVEILALHLTIGETYFFREPGTFEALEHHILPPLIAQRRSEGKRLRIWSAACASGEEIYSIAMLLDRLLPDLEDWNLTLLATDINPVSLKKAAEGIFRDWSFRRMSPDYREQYFRTVSGGREAIDERLRRLITFSYLNLAEPCYPSLLSNTNAMDVIFCRNVLMYFTPELAARTLENLHHCLLEGGWLAVSQTEVALPRTGQFEAVSLSGAVLYRKVSAWQAASAQTIPFQPEPVTPEPFAAELHTPDAMDVSTPAPMPAPDEAPGSGDEPQALPPQAESAADRRLKRASERPDDAAPVALRAQTLAGQGQLEAAAACCERAIALDRLNPKYYYLSAVIAQERGLAEQARQSLRRVLFLAPDFALAHFALGNLAAREGRRAEADRHFANVQRLLAARALGEPLPEGEGLTVGSLLAMIRQPE
ncbi:MAG TPA: CheR family methyltransferase [Blastocatellia bacterium]|nr:CheR family methyltransferase [Blastocatellia bacterium]